MTPDDIVNFGLSVGNVVGSWVFWLLGKNAVFEILGWHEPAPESERVET